MLYFDDNMYYSIGNAWTNNYRLFSYFGLGDSLSADAANFFTPFAVDAALKNDFLLPSEIFEREADISSLVISPTIFSFDIHDIPGTLRLPFLNIFGVDQPNPYAPVQRKCAECEEKAIQPKLTVNAPDDKYEREADQVAESVMRMPRASSDRFPLRRPQPISTIQRTGTAEEHIPGGEARLHSSFEANLRSGGEGGSFLPDNTRGLMESRFGLDFSGVRVHTDATAARLADRIQAQAFTHGTDIYFGQGQFSPETSDGRRLLAHELTHVVQQRPSGSSGATPQAIQRNEEDRAELEARQRECIRESIRTTMDREPTEEEVNAQLQANREIERIHGRRIDVCEQREAPESGPAPPIGANEVFPFPAGSTVRFSEVLTEHFQRSELESLLPLAGEHRATATRLVETLFNPTLPGSMTVTVGESTPRLFVATGRTPHIPASGESADIPPFDVSFTFEWNADSGNFDALIEWDRNRKWVRGIQVLRTSEGRISISVPDPGIVFELTSGEGGSRELSLADVPAAGDFSGLARSVLRLPARLLRMEQIEAAQAAEPVPRSENVLRPQVDIGALRIRSGLALGLDPHTIFGASWIYTFRPLGPLAEFPITFDLMYLGPAGIMGEISAGVQTRVLAPFLVRINTGLAGGGLEHGGGPETFSPMFGPTAGGGIGLELGPHVDLNVDYTGMLNLLEEGPGSLHTISLGSVIHF